jgi:hypothetical protein
MKLIQTITVGAEGADDIIFDSIPKNFTDLIFKISVRTSNASTSGNFSLGINGRFSQRNYIRINGSGTAVTNLANAASGLFGFVPALNAAANTFSNITTYIPDYSSETPRVLHSEGVAENNSAGAVPFLFSSFDIDTSPIQTLRFLFGTALPQGSSISMYGIRRI